MKQRITKNPSDTWTGDSQKQENKLVMITINNDKLTSECSYMITFYNEIPLSCVYISTISSDILKRLISGQTNVPCYQITTKKAWGYPTLLQLDFMAFICGLAKIIFNKLSKESTTLSRTCNNSTSFIWLFPLICLVFVSNAIWSPTSELPDKVVSKADW
jgi:H+/Cl- antiporter ClcA